MHPPNNETVNNICNISHPGRKGLGRDNQGRVEPVPIEILPSGKSLDVCIAIREEKRLKMATGDNGKKKRKKKRKGNIRRLSVNQVGVAIIIHFLGNVQFLSKLLKCDKKYYNEKSKNVSM